MTTYGVDNTDPNQDAPDHTTVPADETAGTGDSAAANQDTTANNDVVDTNAAPADDETVANSAPAGPEVISADSVDAGNDEEAPAAFDGTVDLAARNEEIAKEQEIRLQNEADSKAVAAAQREEDLRFLNENPNVPVARAANPAVGGESFI